MSIFVYEVRGSIEIPIFCGHSKYRFLDVTLRRG